MEEFKTCMMMSKFEMPDSGLLHSFLGFEVTQSDDRIFISQRRYGTNLLKKFNMPNRKPTPTPRNVNEILISEYGTGLADARHYRSIVGGLIYQSHTRPDISFVVSMISMFMHNL